MSEKNPNRIEQVTPAGVDHAKGTGSALTSKKMPVWLKAFLFATLGSVLPQVCQFLPVTAQPICAVLVKGLAVGAQAAQVSGSVEPQETLK